MQEHWDFSVVGACGWNFRFPWFAVFRFPTYPLFFMGVKKAIVNLSQLFFGYFKTKNSFWQIVVVPMRFYSGALEARTV
jgi:hypothetical protein